MKVTLDLDALVAQGKLSAAEAERLKGFAAADTGALGANVLFALGATAVACGVVALLPALETVAGLGVLLFGAGLVIRTQRLDRMKLFGQIVLVIGALALCAGIGGLYGEYWPVRAGLTVGLAVAAVLARSGLLAALAVLAFGVTITFDPDLWPPNHFVLVAIIALSALVLGLYELSLRLAPDYERLAVIAMRMGIVMVNAAFFVGTLAGDDRLGISGLAFTIGWAVALVAFGAWAVFANRRWVVNSVAVFGAIHFFTQWFIVLGAQPISIVGGGVLLIAFGFALARFNNWHGRRLRGEPA
jgi:iron complex transport system permease protein